MYCIYLLSQSSPTVQDLLRLFVPAAISLSTKLCSVGNWSGAVSYCVCNLWNVIHYRASLCRLYMHIHTDVLYLYIAIDVRFDWHKGCRAQNICIDNKYQCMTRWFVATNNYQRRELFRCRRVGRAVLECRHLLTMEGTCVSPQKTKSSPFRDLVN